MTSLEYGPEMYAHWQGRNKGAPRAQNLDSHTWCEKKNAALGKAQSACTNRKLKRLSKHKFPEMCTDNSDAVGGHPESTPRQTITPHENQENSY